MGQKILITEDIAAIKTAIESYFSANSLTVDTMVNEVGYLKVESGTLPPYVIVHDIISAPINTFGHNIVAYEGMYAVESITENTDDNSAEGWATEIHKGVFAALHGKAIPITGFTTMTITLGQREPNEWEEIDDQTSYLHAGFRYLAKFAPQ